MFKFFDRYKRSLAMALAFTLLPNAQIASAASTVLNGEKYDVSVVWEPDQTEVQTGEQVTVTLKADFDKDGDLLDSAEVKIHLDEHEVLALQGIERFLEENEEDVPQTASLSEADKDKEQQITFIPDDDEDGGGVLSFTLDKDNSKLEEELVFLVPPNTKDLTDIWVSEGDIEVTPHVQEKITGYPIANTMGELTEEDYEFFNADPEDYEEEDYLAANPGVASGSNGRRALKHGVSLATGNNVPTASSNTPVASKGDAEATDNDASREPKIFIDTGDPIVILADFNWKVSITEEEKELESDFLLQFSAISENRKPAGTVYTAEQELVVKIQLPEEVKFSDGESKYDSQTGVLSLGNEPVLKLSNVPENAEISAGISDENNIIISISRNAAENAEDELSDAEISVELYRDALENAVREYVKELIEADGENYKHLNDELLKADISVSLHIKPMAGKGEGDKYENYQLILSGISTLRMFEKTVEIKKEAEIDLKDIYILDNNNADGGRPENIDDFIDKNIPLYFSYEEDGKTVYRELTPATWETFFGGKKEEYPEFQHEQVSTSQYILQAKLPITVEETRKDPDTGETTTKTIEYTWTLGAPEDVVPPENYTFIDVNEENVKDYPAAGTNLGYYYVRELPFNFTVKVNDGTKDFDGDKLAAEMLDEFRLVISPMKGEDRTVSLSDLEDAGLLTITTEDDGSICITIDKGLPKYNLDGSMLSYSVKRVSEDGEDEDKFTPDGIGLDAEDNEYFDISYDNAGVPNHGTDKDQVYSGGSITLTLTGTTEYNAKKQWLDDGETDGRSEVTFQLWRYRLESGKTDQFKTAAPVRDASGDFVYMTVDGRVADKDGNLLEKTGLDKYDKEGYEYVYVVVETESKGGTTAYEKIFGTVEYDSASGTFKITDKVETESGEIEEVVYEKDSQGQETNPDRASGNRYVYDGGVLSNKRTDTVIARGVKTWEATAFQAGLDHVKVELTLQYRLKSNELGDDDDWKNTDTIEELRGFQAENHLTGVVEEELPRYDQLGRELEYRWVETGVYERTGDNYSENLIEKNADGSPSFKLAQGGKEYTYTIESEWDGEYTKTDGTGKEKQGSQTTITNRLQDTVDYTVKKTWLDENGKPTDPWKNAIILDLYQLSSGHGADLGEPLRRYKVTEKGYEVLESNGYESEIDQEMTDSWTLTIKDLPELDKTGKKYEYVIFEESNDAIEIKYDYNEETGNYTVDVINRLGGGPGSRNYLIWKQWIDDGDVLHHEPVDVVFYDRKTNKPIEINGKEYSVRLGDEGIWYKAFRISTTIMKPEDVYVLERKVGSQEIDYEPDEILFYEDPQDDEERTFEQSEEDIKDWAERINSKHIEVRTDNHQYEVNYGYDREEIADSENTSPEDRPANDTYIFTVSNRRLGIEDLTVEKIWIDGDGENRKKMQEVIEDYYKEDGITITPAVQLEFEDSNYADDKEYNITYNGITWPSADSGNEQNNDANGDTVNVGGGDVQILDNEGNSVKARQALNLDTDEEPGKPAQTIYFCNLPKYDSDGRDVRYDVREVWLIQKEDNGAVEELSLTEMQRDYPDLYEIVKEYTSTMTSGPEEVNTDHTKLTKTYTLTNKLSGAKEAVWHKQWQDGYNLDKNLRPDIYLEIYRKSKDEVTRLDTVSYRWEYLDEDIASGNEGGEKLKRQWHWHAVAEGLPKYDNDGYEITYYAVEKTSVNAAAFDYEATEYGIGHARGTGDTPVASPTDAEKCYDVDYIGGPGGSNSESGGSDEPAPMVPVSAEGEAPVYALIEGGTFRNKLAQTVVIDGQKLWRIDSLEFNMKNLPGIEVTLQRKSEKGDWEAIAWMKITSDDWESLDRGTDNSYKFEILYEGENVISVNEDGKAETVPGKPGTEPKKLALYDDDGYRYEYKVEETEVLWDSSIVGEDDQLGLDEVYESKTNSYLITNTYKGFEQEPGSLTVKKYLNLPTAKVGEETTVLGYPTVKFELYRNYKTGMDNGEPIYAYTTPQKVSERTWSAGSIKELYEQQKNDSQVREPWQLEHSITFDNLEIHAPNGAPYEYEVREIAKDGSTVLLGDYDTWAAIGDLNREDVQVDENKALDTGTSIQAKVSGIKIKESGDDGTAGGDTREADATFLNQRKGEGRETITIKGTKTWSDFNDAFNTRPDPEIFKSMLTLSRSATGMTSENVKENLYEITVDTGVEDGGAGSSGTADSWNYTITATGSDAETLGELARYAPNGREWKYTLEEDLGVVDQSYQSSGKVNGGSPDVDNIITMSKLANSNQTSVQYRKNWRNAEDTSLNVNLIPGEFQVTFKLQVATASDASAEWRNADEFFAENKYAVPESIKKAYKPVLEGTLSDTKVWDKANAVLLPTYVCVDSAEGVTPETKKYVKLKYRYIETEISYKGDGEEEFKPIANVQLVPESDGKRYHYEYYYPEEQQQSPFFENSAPYNNMPSSTIHTITNRWKTTSLQIEKKWEQDADNAYSTRPKNSSGQWSVAFVIQYTTKDNPEEKDWENLPYYSNGKTGAYIVTVTGANNSKLGLKTVKNLPTVSLDTDSFGQPIQYRAIELNPRINGKLWNEGLWVDTDDESLAEYMVENNGEYHTAYTAEYQHSYSPEVQSDKTTVTNTMDVTSVKADKKWIGNKPDSNIVTLQLQYLKSRDGDTETWSPFTPNGSIRLDGTADKTGTKPFGEFPGWTAVWENLPQRLAGSYLSNEAEKTEYRVVEVEPGNGQNYIEIGEVMNTTNADDTGFSFKVTNLATTELTVTKEWKLAEGATSPESVMVGVYRTKTKPGENGFVVASLENQYKPESEYFGEEYFGNETEQWLTYELNEGNSWRHTFQDLPKYDDSGNPWYYYALEIQIEDGQVNNSAYRQQTPASANYIRYVSESTSDENPDYTVITDITVSSGATVPASHLTVIRNIGYLDIGGTKTWDDQSDRHGLRPENIILTLKRGLRNGAAVEYEKVEGAEPEWDNKTDNSDQWFYTYRHLPAADYNGTPYAYTVEEAPVKNYDVSTASNAQRGGVDFTNRLESVSLQVAKEWRLADLAGKPGSVTVGVYRTHISPDSQDFKPGAESEIFYDSENPGTQLTAVLNTGNEWEHTFQNLPKAEYGENGESRLWYYYALEIAIDDSPINIGSSRNPYNQLAPASQNTVRYKSVSGLDDPNVIIITDITVPRKDDTLHQTNIRNIGLMDIAGQKIWEDGSDRYELRPGTIELTLWRRIAGGDGEWVNCGEKPPVWNNGTLNTDVWTYSYSGLPVSDYNGNSYEYTVTETPVKNYDVATASDAARGGVTFTNTLKQLAFDTLTVSKQWSLAEDAEPAAITVGVYRTHEAPGSTGFDPEKGEAYKLKETGEQLTAVLNGTDGWSHTFDGLPRYDINDQRWYYYALEIAAAGRPIDGDYDRQTGSADDAVRFKSESGLGTPNTYTIITDIVIPGDDADSHETRIRNIGFMDIHGTKTWVDEDDRYGRRPDGIELTLLRRMADRGGEWTDCNKKPTWGPRTENIWDYYYNGLPVADSDGNYYEYTVVETPVENYDQVATSSNAENGVDFENTLTYTPDPGRPGGGGGGGSTPNRSVTVTDMPVPLAPLPSNMEIIEDEPVPLAAPPKTGDRSRTGLYGALFAISMAGLSALLALGARYRRKKHGRDDE